MATGSCMVFNAYGTWPDRSFCKVRKVAFPSSEQELVGTVAYGVKNNMKMKVVSRSAHSSPKLVCPGGASGLVISTANYSRGVIIDANAKTATVDSGVELQELLEIVGSSGFALPASPYWSGISIGGLLSTGSHGSSLWGKGSAVHEYVVAMRIVIPASAEEGYAKVVSFGEADQEQLNAAKVSLGVLGAISQVTLALEPLFKRSVTFVELPDVNLEKQIVQFGRNHEFGDISWYPSRYKAVFREDDRVPVSANGDSVNKFIGFQPTLVPVIVQQRTTEEAQEALGDAAARCASALVQSEALLAVGQGYKSLATGIFTGYPVIGFQHRLQSAGGCQHSTSSLEVCPWDPTIRGLFYHQTTVSIAVDKIQSFVADVKKLRRLNPSSLCGVDLYNGLLMRYVKASTAFLGKQADSVDVDITYYRARDGNSPRLDEDVLEEIEQIALFKYGGLPHWGKNRNVGFVGMASKYPRLQRFLEVKEQLDPQGLFSSEWSDSVLLNTSSTGPQIFQPHCALEGLCICSQDSHCAPDKYYFCRPGKVYREARVCRFEASS